MHTYSINPRSNVNPCMCLAAQIESRGFWAVKSLNTYKSLDWHNNRRNHPETGPQLTDESAHEPASGLRRPIQNPGLCSEAFRCGTDKSGILQTYLLPRSAAGSQPLHPRCETGNLPIDNHTFRSTTKKGNGNRLRAGLSCRPGAWDSAAWWIW